MESTLDSLESLQQLYQQQRKHWAVQFSLLTSQVTILLTLDLKQPAFNLAELVQASQLDISTMSRQLSTMVKSDLLTKSLGELPRQRIYRLTEIGHQKATALQEQRQALETDILANWGSDERQLLKILLNRYHQSFARLQS